jgi:hypothetical protein
LPVLLLTLLIRQARAVERVAWFQESSETGKSVDRLLTLRPVLLYPELETRFVQVKQRTDLFKDLVVVPEPLVPALPDSSDSSDIFLLLPVQAAFPHGTLKFPVQVVINLHQTLTGIQLHLPVVQVKAMSPVGWVRVTYLLLVEFLVKTSGKFPITEIYGFR